MKVKVKFHLRAATQETRSKARLPPTNCISMMLQRVIYLYIYAGVHCVHLLTWLPCEFIDELLMLKNNETHTERLHRDAVLQFGQRGDRPVHPQALTFLLTGPKLDLQRSLEEAEPQHLGCELHRYSTQGIQVHWPAQAPQEHNSWFRCTIKHTGGSFIFSVFLRQSSTEPPPAQLHYNSWPAIKDGDILTTTVAMVLQTRSPSVRAALTSQQQLHCQFAVDHKRPNFTVEWYQQHRGEKTPLFSHNSYSRQSKGTGVVLKGSSAGQEASLSLPYIKMKHDGTYVCSVSITPLSLSLDVTLQIQEAPRVSLNIGPTLSLVVGTDQKVVCEAERYYPLDVEMAWYKEKVSESGQKVGSPLPEKLQTILLSSHKHNNDQTFSLSAFFYLEPSLRDSGTRFTCSVSHLSLRAPIRKSFILYVDEPTSWMLLLSVGFFVVTVLALLCVMLHYLHSERQKSKRKPY
ncbi:tapasin-related protein [Genypterus blacodes]|uniref:tapasin-related protein n=1 Tax=Genypterus blacodes TaxID=154954 RepID=UPI003F75AC0D